MVLDQDYPSENHLYGDVFVHTRVKEYLKFADVLIVSFFKDFEEYEYETVKVKSAPTLAAIFDIYTDFAPDFIFLHFYDRKLFPFLKSIKTSLFVWVHGYEALGWYRRLFNFNVYGFLRNVHNIVIPNIEQMIGFRKLVKFSNKNRRIHFVFVSDWMKNVAQVDSAIKIKNHSIIPNPINTDLFRYTPKKQDDRKRILLIRSFDSRKYANDVAVEAILLLSSTDIFKDLHFSIYGKGKYFQTLTQPLNRFKNIEINEGFIANVKIPQIHEKFGIFLCPTRQDAQGVSMCEAMSSGLVPVTSNNTAIPEFVEHGKTGILTNSAKDIADAIEQLYKEPSFFLTISENASAFIKKSCDIKNVTTRELALIDII